MGTKMEKCLCAEKQCVTLYNIIKKRRPKRRTLKTWVLASLIPETHTGVNYHPLSFCLTFFLDWGIPQGNDSVLFIFVVLVSAIVLSVQLVLIKYCGMKDWKVTPKVPFVCCFKMGTFLYFEMTRKHTPKCKVEQSFSLGAGIWRWYFFSVLLEFCALITFNSNWCYQEKIFGLYLSGRRVWYF